MIQSHASADAAPPNHPHAVRMGVIAAISFNVVIGTVFGSFGVMLRSVEARLGVTPEMSAAAIPLVMVGSSILASVAGVLAARFSLRLLMTIAAVLMTTGWLLLALTINYTLYLVAYGLCFGPAMALGAVVAPATLVTRWFTRNRGLALGLVHLPILVGLLPVVCNWTLNTQGATFTYLMLAAMSGLVMLPASLLVREHPPGMRETAATVPGDAPPVSGQIGIAQLLRRPRFWAFVLAVAALNTSSVVLGAHLVAMALSWGFDGGHGALLTSIMSTTGIAGSILFGWVSDRIGGGRTLALTCLGSGLLWLLLLAGLPFAAVAVTVALIGLNGSGAIPAISRGIGEAFGPQNFSRAYGLSTTIALPINIAGVMGTARVFQLEGDYVPAIAIMVAYFAIAVPLALYAARGRIGPATAPATA